MWRVILGTVCVLTVVLFVLVLMFGAGAKSHEKTVQRDGMAGMSGRERLREIHSIVESLLAPNLYDTDASFLSLDHSKQLREWLAKYDKSNKEKK